MKQKTIGLNPLEEYLSKNKDNKENLSSTSLRDASESIPQEAQSPVAEGTTPLILVGEPVVAPETKLQVVDGALKGKQRITLHISAEVIDRLKNAVYWEPGLTLAGFAEEALENALNEMEDERGKPFPQRRQHRLKGGRPII